MAMVSDNLYISDLPVGIDDALVQKIFCAYGTITSFKVLPPKQLGQKGAALVRFASQQEATWIVDNLNGNMPEGLNEPVFVKYANNPQSAGYGKGYGKSWAGGEQRSAPYDNSYGYGGKGDGYYGGKGDGYGGKGKDGKGSIKSLIIGASKQGILPGGGQKIEENCVYIKGLPKDTTDLELYRLVAPFGALAQKGVTAMMHPDGTCTSIGFVDFQESQSAQACIAALNGFECPDGTSLFVKIKELRKGKGEGKDGKEGGKKGKDWGGKDWGGKDWGGKDWGGYSQ